MRRRALMVGPGLGVGILVSLAARTLFAGFLYGVGPSDPATIVGVSVALALVALGASAWPAWRATRIDPMLALRGE
jgi:putative ABC transport system permease protein